MNFEESRLRTFEKWPTNAPVDPRRIAKAGFYFTGRELEVQCFSCGSRISEWNYADTVMERHRVLDPNCPFVKNPLDSGNVPVQSGSFSGALNGSQRLPRSQGERSSSNKMHNSLPSDGKNGSINGNTYHSEQSRLNSFSQWPISTIVSPEKLAKSGFFYTQISDKVQCAFCNLIISGWEPGDDPDILHRKHYSGCTFIDNTVFRNLDIAAGTNVTNGHSGRMALGDYGAHRVSRNPKYSTYESRLSSFVMWPLGLAQKPEELAEAGFYFTGRGDLVRCYYCDGGVRLWEQSEVPWEMHARCFPECGFTLSVKGQPFVDHILLSKPPVLPVLNRDLRNAAQRPSVEIIPKVRIVSEEELQGLMSTPSAVAALQVGIEASRVKQALKQKMEQTGFPFSSPDSLIGAAIEIQNEESSSQEVGETWSTPPDSPLLGWTRAAPRRAYRESSSEPETDPDEPEVLSTIPLERIKHDEEDDHVVVKPNSPKEDEKSLLEEENRKLREARLCKICMDNDTCVLFMPCRHFVTCVGCALSVSCCPLCRQHIKAMIQAFLS